MDDNSSRNSSFRHLGHLYRRIEQRPLRDSAFGEITRSMLMVSHPAQLQFGGNASRSAKNNKRVQIIESESLDNATLSYALVINSLEQVGDFSRKWISIDME